MERAGSNYELLGIPRTPDSDAKAQAAVKASLAYPLPPKASRDLLNLQQENMSNTLKIFENIDFTEEGNTFVDDVATDGGADPYYLFPTQNAKNGGYSFHGENVDKYVIPMTSTTAIPTAISPPSIIYSCPVI